MLGITTFSSLHCQMLVEELKRRDEVALENIE